MTALELQERKNRVLDILQTFNSEEAISYMEALARKLIKICAISFNLFVNGNSIEQAFQAASG